MDSGLSSTLNLTLDEIIKDLRKNSNCSDDVYAFSPSLWLESPERNYCSFLYNISLSPTYKSEPFHFFYIKLLEISSKFLSTEAEDPITIKLILIICQFIKILPHDSIRSEIDNILKSLLFLPYNSSSISNFIRKSIIDVIIFSIVNGCNPIPAIFTQEKDIPLDIFLIFDLLPKIICSASSFCSLLSVISQVNAMITQEKQTLFIEKLYKITSKFFKNFPLIHQQLIISGVPEAQTIISIILQWKSTPEPEWIPLLSSFLPFCHQWLNESVSHKKSPILTVLKGIDDLKTWKPNVRYLRTLEFLELFETNLVVVKHSPSLFIPLRKVTDAIYKKIIPIITSPDAFSSEQTLEILSKFAAIEYSMNHNQTPVYDFVIDQLNQSDNWNLFLETEKLIYSGFPLAINQSTVTIPDKILQKMIKFISSITYHFKLSAKQDESFKPKISIITQIASFLVGSEDHLFNMEENTPLIYLMKGNPYGPITPLVQYQQFFKMISAPADQYRLIGSFIKFVLGNIPKNLSVFLRFIRYAFCNNECFISSLIQMDIKSISSIIISLIYDFQEAALYAILNFLPSFNFLPLLYNSFLSWIKFILNTKSESTHFQKISIPDETLETLNNLLFLLSSFYDNVDFPLFVETNNLIDNVPKRIRPSKDLVLKVVDTWFSGVLYRAKKDGYNIKYDMGHFGKAHLGYGCSRNQIASLTRFLLKYIYILTDPMAKVTTVEKGFFNVCYLYISGSKEIESHFSSPFKYTYEKSISSFLTVTQDVILKYAKKCSFGTDCFWGTVIKIITKIISSSGFQNSQANITCVEKILPVLLSFLQLGIFNEKQSILIKLACKLLVKFYTLPIKKGIIKSTIVYTSCIKTIFESLIQYHDSTHIFLEYLPAILKNYRFDISNDCPHMNQFSYVLAIENLWFILSNFDKLLIKLTKNDEISKPEIAWSINQIQLCLDELLDQNTEIMWQLLIHAIEKCSSLLGFLCSEALSLLISSPPTMFQSSIKTQETQSSSSNNEGQINDNESYLIKLAYELRTWNYSIDPKKIDDLHNDIIAKLSNNNYQLLKEPPTDNLDFIRSAAYILMDSAKHVEAFDSITKEYIKSGNLNPFITFYKGWFRAMTKGWSMESFIQTAKPESRAAFLRLFDPPSSFAFFFRRLSFLGCSNAVIKEIFVTCFLTPLLLFPFQYDTPLIKADLTIQSILSHPNFDPLINSLINAETIYPQPKTININGKVSRIEDYEIVFHFIGEKPTPFDEINVFPQSGLIPAQLILNKNSKWIQNIGKMADGSTAFLISPNRVMESITTYSFSYFLSAHLTSFQSVELFIDGSNVPSQFKEYVFEFRKAAKVLLNKISRITFLNTSISSISSINSLTPFVNKNIRFIDDIESELTPQDKIYLPKEFFLNNSEKRLTVEVHSSDKLSQLTFYLHEIRISSQYSIAGSSHSASLSFSFKDINIISKERKLILTNTISDGLSNEVTIESDKIELIQHAISLAKNVSISTIPDFQSLPNSSATVSIATLGIYLSSVSSSLRPAGWRQGLIILENIIRKSKEIDTTYIVQLDDATKIIDNLIPFIQQTDLLPQISFELIEFLNRNEMTDPYSPFTKLLLVYINSVTTECDPILYKVISGLIHLSYSDSWKKYLMIHLWSYITNPQAIESILVSILDQDIDLDLSHVITQIKNPSSFNFSNEREKAKTLSRIIIHSLVHGDIHFEKSSTTDILLPKQEDNRKIVSSIITKLMTGLVRKRPYGRPQAVQRLFRAISALPYEVDLFEDNKFISLLLFAALMTIIDRTQESSKDIRIFLSSFLETKINIDASFSNIETKLSTLLSQPKALDPLALISEMNSLVRKCSDDIYNSYQELFTEDENPGLWYIKAAAYQGLLEKTSNFPRLVTSLPSIWFSVQNPDDSADRIIKLSLAFHAMAVATGLFPNPRAWPGPVYAIWPAIMAASTSNSSLRKAVLEYIGAAVHYARQGGYNILLQRDKNINEWIAAYEMKLGCSFQENFPLAFTQSLLKGLIEIDSRAIALSIIKELYLEMPCQIFSLALAAFDTENPPMPLVDVFREIGSSPAKTWMINFITQAFLDRSTYHRVSVLSAGLIHLAKNAPSLVASTKTKVLEKCWKFMDNETSHSKGELFHVAKVAACYLAIPSKEDEELSLDLLNGKMKKTSKNEWLPNVDDNAIKDLLSGSLPAIANTFSFD